MTNKKLEQEIDIAIRNEVYIEAEMQPHGKAYYKLRAVDKAAKSSASITIEHMKGFAEWMNKNDYFQVEDRWWQIGENYNPIILNKTTEELIQLYFDSLNK